MTHHDDCTGYDFAAGSAFGLRSFNVDDLGRLKGVTHKRVWRPGENVAVCNAGEELKQGRCDNDEHGCGFWAYHDGSTYDSGRIHGVIEGYGKTTVGTKGFRCEKARIVALALTVEGKRPKVERSRWDRFCLWSHHHTGWVVAPTVIIGLAGAVCLIPSIAEGAWLAIVPAAIALIAALMSVRANFRGLDLEHAKWRSKPFPTFSEGPEPLSTDLVAKIRRNYPDVKVYDSVAAMKKAHPVDQALEPTPETDPSFWEDDWTPETDAALRWTAAVPTGIWSVASYDRALRRMGGYYTGGSVA